jgi:hypothetical protein
LKSENKNLKKVSKITKNITNNTTNHINNGTVNNFNLYAHGKEDLDRIDKDDLLTGIKNGFNSTTKLTELINFNPKYPEYHNVYISNVKSKYAMKFDGNNWTLVRKNDLIDDIYEQKRDYIYINMDNYSKSLSKVQRESIDRWMLLDEINPDDPVIRRIKSDIELLLYNSRDIPLATMEGPHELLLDDDIKKKIENKIKNNSPKTVKVVKKVKTAKTVKPSKKKHSKSAPQKAKTKVRTNANRKANRKAKNVRVSKNIKV